MHVYMMHVHICIYTVHCELEMSNVITTILSVSISMHVPIVLIIGILPKMQIL